MRVIKKTLLLTVTLLYITFINVNTFAKEFDCIIKTATEYTVEECEKDRIDEFITVRFSYSDFSNTEPDYCGNQEKNFFQLSTVHYKPPISS